MNLCASLLTDEILSSSAVERILQRAGPIMINIAKSDGFTALHLAALNGLAEIVTTLVRQVRTLSWVHISTH